MPPRVVEGGQEAGVPRLVEVRSRIAAVLLALIPDQPFDCDVGDWDNHRVVEFAWGPAHSGRPVGAVGHTSRGVGVRDPGLNQRAAPFYLHQADRGRVAVGRHPLVQRLAKVVTDGGERGEALVRRGEPGDRRIVPDVDRAVVDPGNMWEGKEVDGVSSVVGDGWVVPVKGLAQRDTHVALPTAHPDVAKEDVGQRERCAEPRNGDGFRGRRRRGWRELHPPHQRPQIRAVGADRPGVVLAAEAHRDGSPGGLTPAKQRGNGGGTLEHCVVTKGRVERESDGWGWRRRRRRWGRCGGVGVRGAVVARAEPPELRGPGAAPLGVEVVAGAVLGGAGGSTLCPGHVDEVEDVATLGRGVARVVRVSRPARRVVDTSWSPPDWSPRRRARGHQRHRRCEKHRNDHLVHLDGRRQE
eukprot:m.269438 g.269438  ORF g.269438 m.269438 type:complete len:412 (+) comp26832_c1_seq10:521-1756(+)